MSEHYVVMYHGENLYSYQMTNEEKSLVENLRRTCMETLDGLDIPRSKLADGSPYMGRLLDNHDFYLKFKNNIGYYVLDGERGIYTMRKGFPEQNSEKAKFRILTYEYRISSRTAGISLLLLSVFRPATVIPSSAMCALRGCLVSA